MLVHTTNVVFDVRPITRRHLRWLWINTV